MLCEKTVAQENRTGAIGPDRITMHLTPAMSHAGSKCELVCEGGDSRIVLQRVRLHGCSVIASYSHNTTLQMITCQVVQAEAGLLVQGPTVQVTEKCRFEGCIQGVVVRCTGTSVVLRDCAIVDSIEAGVWVDCGAKVRMDNTSVIGVKKGNALNASGQWDGQDWAVVAAGCKFLDAQASGIALTAGAHCELRKCTVSGAQQSGVQVSGAGSLLEAVNCTCSGNQLAGVSVGKGASARLRGGCTLSGSKAGEGLAVEGQDASAAAKEDCVFANNHGSAVAVRDGAQVDLQDCELKGSCDSDGLEVDEGRVDARRCSFSDNSESGVMLIGGAKAKLDSCQMTGSRAYHGLQVTGEGTKVEATNCICADNFQSGVLVVEGAHAKLHKCEFLRSKHFHGLQIADTGSKVDATDCICADNQESGIDVFGGAKATLRNCHIDGSKTLNGLGASGAGTQVDAHVCSFGHNACAGVLAASRAVVHLWACTTSGRMGHTGMAVETAATIENHLDAEAVPPE